MPSATAIVDTPAEPTSTAISHQQGPVLHHWNDLPAHLAHPSSTTSLPSSGREYTPADFSTFLSALYALPTKVPEKEVQMIRARLEKAEKEGKVSDAHKVVLAGVLDEVVSGRVGAKEGRENVVQFMVREKGVSLWCGGIRRLVEGLQV